MTAKSPQVEYVNKFNQTLKILATDLSKRMPNDATVARTHKRIMGADSVDPLVLINTVGPHLFRYQKQIWDLHNDTTEAFFLANTYETELSRTDKEKADLVSYLIPKAKECARGLPPDAKKQYKDMIIKLLDIYVEYLTACAEEQAARAKEQAARAKEQAARAEKK